MSGPLHSGSQSFEEEDGGAAPTEIISTEELEHRVTHANRIDVGCSGSAVWSVSSAKHGNGVQHAIHYHDTSTFWQSDGILPHIISIQLAQLTPVEAIAIYLNSVIDESYSPRVIRVKTGTHIGDMAEVAAVDVGTDVAEGWLVLPLNDNGDVAPVAEEEIYAEGNDNDDNDDDGGFPHSSTKHFTNLGIPSSTGQLVGGAVTSSDTAAPASHMTSFPFSFVPNIPDDGADRWLWCTLIDIYFYENQLSGRDCHVRGVRVIGPRRAEVEEASLVEVYPWEWMKLR